MHYFDNTRLKDIIVIHYIGNKINQESLIFSKEGIYISDDLNNTLNKFFLSQFKNDEYFKFSNEVSLSLNEVFFCVSNIFENPNEIFNQSKNLAKLLFEHSVHPKIKAGEFYTVYFKDCIIEGRTVDAVGLFKTENKDTFLKVITSAKGFEIESVQGININKLDKGCLIFNTEKENGYIVSVIDNTNKGNEAQYWIDDFLHVCQRKDEYSNTQNVLSLCKNFITKELPNEFEIAKADQIDLLNKSLSFFKEKDNFDIEDFTREVIKQPEIIEKFESFRDEFEEINDFKIDNSFAISNNAVKKLQRSIKRIISLDEKIKIIIEGNREHIEQGIDEKGRKYYKIFYQEEL